MTRRIVNKNWQNSIRPIRDAISQAVNDMPEHEELVKLLSGSHINYFHCLQILEILAKTEADTKNLFGRYSSQRYTSWQDIIKSYERDSVYLAEAAQIFCRNVAYEIPGIKKQIAHLEKQEEEAHKKINDLNRSETGLRNEYNAICEQFKVKSDNIRECLIRNLADLPQMHDKVAKFVPALTKAVTLYSSFANNTDVLPLIRHIATNGNTTVYQFVYGEAPLSVEEPPLKIEIDPEETQTTASDQYDLGGDGIDFNVGEEINLEVGDIDWGDDNQVQNEPNDVADFNISLEESGIVVEQTGCSGGVAKGDEAYTLLDSTRHRDQFIDELYELEAFLKLRLYELSTADGKHQIMTIGSVGNFADHDAKTVIEMLSNVEVTISAATDETLYHLHQIKHSHK